MRSLRALRGPVLVGTLLGAAWLYAGQVADARSLAVLDGTYLADGTSAHWGLLFCAGTLVAWLFSVRYYGDERPFQSEHDVLLLCTPIGMATMAGAQNLIVFFVGLELLSIPLYALAAFRRDQARSVEAGVKYFLLGAFAAAFFLYGAGLAYTATGSVEISGLAAAEVTPLLSVGIALMIASLFFKISVFPFHLWVPDVYQGSPTPVTALMATGTKAAAFAFLLNMLPVLPPGAATPIGVVALVTMALGNLGALVQTDVKRMLAYSGVAHAGTVLLVIAAALAVAGDPEASAESSAGAARAATNAALFYFGAYVFTAAGAFGVLASLERDGEGATTLDGLRGLWSRRPWAAAAMGLFMLSLGGIPATGGFLGKYLVFAVAVEAHMIGFAIVGALLSVVALGYYLRVIVAMTMQSEEGEPRRAARERPLPAALAAAVCALLVIALGIAPSFLLDRL